MTWRNYRDKVAVVTGAGSGIGRALAVQLAAAGARLALSDISEQGLAETLASLPEGTEARGYRLDVSKRDEVFDHAEEVRRDFGTAHYVFNNAGVTLFGTIAHCTIEEFEWQIGINLWGVIYGTKAFLPMLLAQNEGHVVNFSSVFGLVTVPCQGAYHVSKFGVRGFTECLSRELERTRVKAASVHPGGIATAIGAKGRFCAAAGAEEAGIAKMVPKMLTTPPEECARDVLDGVARGRRRLLVGSHCRSTDLVQRLLPESYGKVLKLLGM